MSKKKSIPSEVKRIQKHTLKEVNYAYEKVISYSQMSMFYDCPHKWALQYRDGHYVSEPSIHSTFGTSFHEAFQHYLTVLYNVSAAEADRINLEEYFEERLRENYLKDYNSNNKVHFSSSEEIREFYDDGVAILNFIKKKRGGYFSKKGWHLVGCEIPLLLTPHPEYKNVLYKGYLDIVLYHEPTNTYKIVDVKTSGRGWDYKKKKDDIKQYQLVLYKKYYSQQFGVPEDDIEIEFFIVKRKIWEDSPYPISRIQEHVPTSGKIKMGKATKTMNDFIEQVFNLDGSYKTTSFEPNPGEWKCKYCPFRNDKTLCSSGISS